MIKSWNLGYFLDRAKSIWTLCDVELHYRYEASAKFSQQKHPTLLSLSGVFSRQVSDYLDRDPTAKGTALLWCEMFTNSEYYKTQPGFSLERRARTSINLLESLFLCGLYFNTFLPILKSYWHSDYTFSEAIFQRNLVWSDPSYLSIKVKLLL